MQALSWDMWQFQTLLRDMIWGMPVGPFGPYGPNKLNEMYARKRYREHNAYVRGKMVEYERNGGVLKDKFLEYKVGEGWKPLCDFVGAKVPNESFPHSNQKGSLVVEVGFFPRIRKIANVFRFRVVALFCLIIAALSFFLKMCFQ